MTVHTGTTGLGAGMPGGGRLKLGLSRPMYVDAVAADFPDLQIVMAHPAWPWQDEQLAVALHKPTTWIDNCTRTTWLTFGRMWRNMRDAVLAPIASAERT